MKTCLRCTRMKNVNKGGGAADPQPKFDNINEEKCGDKTGTINYYNEVKGIGHITPDPATALTLAADPRYVGDIPFNLTSDDKNLLDPDVRVCFKVSYELLIATNIRIIK